MKTRAAAYAAAALELAIIEDKVEEIDQDLRFIAETVNENIKLKDTLVAADVDIAQKLAVVKGLFQEKVSGVSLNFFNLLISQGDVKQLDEILRELVEKIQKEENKIIAEVITAIELDKAMQSGIEKSLSKVSGKEVKLRSKVDRSVIGGIVIRFDGKLYDGSLLSKLNGLKSKMLIGKA